LSPSSADGGAGAETAPCFRSRLRPTAARAVEACGVKWKLLDLPNLLQIKDDAYRNALFTDPKVLMWGTLMFTALGLMQVGRAFSARSFFEPFWKQPFSTNKVLLRMIFTVIVMLMLVVYTPGVQAFFHVVGLSGANHGLSIAFAILVLVIMELAKAYERRKAAAS
jgi:magnesium-transporting ATPase (P-type)